MSKTGSANGSFFGNFIYDLLLRRRSHFLFDLSRAVDFSFVAAALKDFSVDWGRALHNADRSQAQNGKQDCVRKTTP